MTENNEKVLNPFRVVHRGEDTLGLDNETVVFSDFTPRIVPADQPEAKVEAPAPKGESAQEPVPSLESPSETEPTKSETPAQAPVEEVAGKPSLTVPGKLASSSNKKSG